MLDIETFNSRGLEITIATALGGTYYLTSLLRDQLKRGNGRVVNVSSGGQYTVSLDPEDLQNSKLRGKNYDGTLIYSLAKKSQVALTKKWSQVEPNIGFYSMHPGWTETPRVKKALATFSFLHGSLFREVEEGADTAVWLATTNETTKLNSGRFYFDRKIVATEKLYSGTEYNAKDLDSIWEQVKNLYSDLR